MLVIATIIAKLFVTDCSTSFRGAAPGFAEPIYLTIAAFYFLRCRMRNSSNYLPLAFSSPT